MRLPQYKGSKLVISENPTHLSSPTSPGGPTHSFKAKHTSKSMRLTQNCKLTSVYYRVILVPLLCPHQLLEDHIRVLGEANRNVVSSLVLLHAYFKTNMQNEVLVIINFNSSSGFEGSVLRTLYYCFTV